MTLTLCPPGSVSHANPRSMVMARAFSSASRSGSMPVSALTRVDFPWSTCPAVPITNGRIDGIIMVCNSLAAGCIMDVNQSRRVLRQRNVFLWRLESSNSLSRSTGIRQHEIRQSCPYHTVPLSRRAGRGGRGVRASVKDTPLPSSSEVQHLQHLQHLRHVHLE